jgi:voltage-gated potassium channel Kch
LTPAPNAVPQAKKRIGALRRRVYAVLEQGDGADGVSLALNRFLIVLIVATLTATVMETVPDMAKAYAVPLSAVEWAATFIFSLEYAARLWSAAEHPLLKRGAVFGRLRFVLSFSGLVDLAAILPFWLSVFIASDFRVLLVLRLVRFFKLTRYSPAMRSLLDALYAERRALAGCFVILLGTALIAAALMHLAERAAQPERFGTIPDALWWAIVTLGTIGYGDVVPITVLGRVLASFTIFAGLLMMALPVGIRYRLRQRGPPQGFHHHLGPRLAHSSVQQLDRGRDRRGDDDAARAESRQRHGNCSPRRTRPCDVSDRRRRSGSKTAAQACQAWYWSILRRDRGAAPHATLGNRDGLDADAAIGTGYP